MDNVELLLEELRVEGFPTEQFDSTLRANINLGLSPFKVKCERPFGDELMRCQLVISKADEEDSRYQLSGLIATHRSAVKIANKIYKGISTQQLDDDMAKVDWHDYFYRTEGLIDTVTQGVAGSIIMRLVKLAKIKDPGARAIQQQLMYKHWPEDAFEIYRMNDLPNLKAGHEHTYTFSSKSYDRLNANLAFMVISERYDILLNKIRQTGITYHGFNLQKELMEKISGDPDNFSVDGHYNDTSGHVIFSMPVERNKEEYSLKDYQVTFTPYPRIQHGVYNGIDTAELEILMQAVDWQDENEIFDFAGGGIPDFAQRIEEILQRLDQLRQDVAGEYFAGILQLKYMLDTGFFEELIPQKVLNLLDRLPKLQRRFPADMNVDIAVNMLSGRAVSEHLWKGEEENSGEWVRLDLFNPNNDFPIIQAGTFNEAEVFQLTLNSPLIYPDRRSLCDHLMRGDVVSGEAPSGGKILVVANPEQKSLDFWTPDGRRIPINLHLDPDWKPTEVHENVTDKTQQKTKPVASINKKARTPKKGRGKGL